MAYPEDPHPADANSHPPQPPLGQPPPSQLEQQRLQREAARHAQARRVTVLDKFVQGIIYLVVSLEVLLGLRFMLRLTAANPDNTFAGVIYGLSDPFVTPFSTLFISPTVSGSQHIFDINVLVAMTAYLALLGLFLGFLRIFIDSRP
ncbi:YggT family protein [Leptolyngbya sp. PCC 6406]|uniref:YggT family protein n=1 Tax=Leptolyngbya sp. PCC 6406 TaxID=1173264 RepID=UPI0002ABB0D2|nr:YggT family protein [Leptolyngbya sp. PCC 6406]